MLKNACKYLHELKLEIDYNSDCSEAMEAKSDINMWKEKIQETCQILFQHSAMADNETGDSNNDGGGNGNNDDGNDSLHS